MTPRRHENCTRRGVKSQEQASLSSQGSTVSNRRTRKPHSSRPANGTGDSIPLKVTTSVIES